MKNIFLFFLMFFYFFFSDASFAGRLRIKSGTTLSTNDLKITSNLSIIADSSGSALNSHATLQVLNSITVSNAINVSLVNSKIDLQTVQNLDYSNISLTVVGVTPPTSISDFLILAPSQKITLNSLSYSSSEASTSTPLIIPSSSGILTMIDQPQEVTQSLPEVPPPIPIANGPPTPIIEPPNPSPPSLVTSNSAAPQTPQNTATPTTNSEILANAISVLTVDSVNNVTLFLVSFQAIRGVLSLVVGKFLTLIMKNSVACGRVFHKSNIVFNFIYNKF